MKEKILIIEDDIDINNMLCEVLITYGFQAHGVSSGTDGLVEVITNNYDLILLDLNLPFLDGEQVLKEIRKKSDVPVIIISAKSDKSTKIELLNEGADDFITKPLDLDETLARINSTLRRYIKIDKVKEIIHRELRINKESMVVTYNQKIIELRPIEYRILLLLLENPNRVYSKNLIFENVWNDNYIGDENTINVHMSKLRTKLDLVGASNYIETIWGVGYKLV